MRSIQSSKLIAPTGSVVVVKPSSSSSSSTNAPPSPWHSPIPYLFGGLATIMGLIAFALLMLACSYWTLITTPSQDPNLLDNNNKHTDDPQNKEPIKPYEEKILVIMAGDDKPTFLATPLRPNSSSSSSSSFPHPLGDNFHKHLGNSQDSDKSHKEIMDNHAVLENGNSQHQQHI
ncbi:hypothetical protein VNO77_32318 [Canavalia gladiata]|uniref:Uncharacterized protein n=1 Tax=Canavalia gladiata TaxID=3824 RepID=A0AAN9KQL9_CANGL